MSTPNDPEPPEEAGQEQLRAQILEMRGLTSATHFLCDWCGKLTPIDLWAPEEAGDNVCLACSELPGETYITVP